MNRTDDLDAATRLVERLTSVGVCVSCLEYLVHPHQLKDEGLLSWKVSRLRYRWLSSGPVARAFDLIFSYPAILVFLSLRLLAALTLVCAPTSKEKLRSVLTVGLAASGVGLTLRSAHGHDGSDQMSTVSLTALTIGKFPLSSRLVQEACLWFITLQACLSYAVSGFAKVVSPTWRDGSALTGIFRTQVYGQEGLYKFLKQHPRRTAWIARMGVLWESSFPLILIVPKPLTRLFLAGGALFHGATAVFMGLNKFFWAFVATYPAIVYCLDRRAKLERHR